MVNGSADDDDGGRGEKRKRVPPGSSAGWSAPQQATSTTASFPEGPRPVENACSLRPAEPETRGGKKERGGERLSKDRFHTHRSCQ